MLLRNPVIPSKYVKEATVFSVDVKRNVCSCRADTGQIIDAVTWLNDSGGSGRYGSTNGPVFGNKVIISFHLGYPLIIGYKPLIYDKVLGLPNRLIESEETVETDDIGDLSFINSPDLGVNESLPPEAVAGDHILSTTGGSLLGVLRGGSLLLKASPLAQIFISKIDDLARILARNFELFTDTHTDVCANLKNRQYRFVGYADSVKDVREDRYHYFELYGDTEAAESVKGNYKRKQIESSPAKTGIIKRQKVVEYDSPEDDGYSETYSPVYDFTLDLSGNMKRTVRKADGTIEALVDHNFGQLTYTLHDEEEDSIYEQYPGRFHKRVNGSNGYYDWDISGDGAILDWNGDATISTNSSGITIDWKGNGIVTLDDGGITASWAGGSSRVVLASGTATLEGGGHRIVVSSGGIAMS